MFESVYKWFRDLIFISRHTSGKYKSSKDSNNDNIKAKKWLNKQRLDKTDVYEYADADGLEYAFQHRMENKT